MVVFGSEEVSLTANGIDEIRGYLDGLGSRSVTSYHARLPANMPRFTKCRDFLQSMAIICESIFGKEAKFGRCSSLSGPTCGVLLRSRGWQPILQCDESCRRRLRLVMIWDVHDRNDQSLVDLSQHMTVSLKFAVRSRISW